MPNNPNDKQLQGEIVAIFVALVRVPDFGSSSYWKVLNCLLLEDGNPNRVQVDKVLKHLGLQPLPTLTATQRAWLYGITDARKETILKLARKGQVK